MTSQYPKIILYNGYLSFTNQIFHMISETDEVSNNLTVNVFCEFTMCKYTVLGLGDMA